MGFTWRAKVHTRRHYTVLTVCMADLGSASNLAGHLGALGAAVLGAGFWFPHKEEKASDGFWRLLPAGDHAPAGPTSGLLFALDRIREVAEILVRLGKSCYICCSFVWVAAMLPGLTWSPSRWTAEL